MMHQISRTRWMIALAAAAVLLAAKASAQTTQTSTEQEQKDLAVTVYNSNVALVRDVRRVQLSEGMVDLRYVDIAASVNPVMTWCLTVPGSACGALIVSSSPEPAGRY